MEEVTRGVSTLSAQIYWSEIRAGTSPPSRSCLCQKTSRSSAGLHKNEQTAPLNDNVSDLALRGQPSEQGVLGPKRVGQSPTFVVARRARVGAKRFQLQVVDNVVEEVRLADGDAWKSDVADVGLRAKRGEQW